MKSTALFCIALVVGSLASPTITFMQDEVLNAANEERIVTGQIVNAIEDFAQSIRDAGLDPFDYTGSVDYKLPVPVLFNANAFVDALSFTGLSNIVVNSINYGVISRRLTFNISIPRISLQIRNSGFRIIYFGDEYTGTFSGSLDVIQPRIVGDVQVGIGISGISISSVDLDFALEGIQSNLKLNLLGNNLSSEVNTYLGQTLPSRIKTFRAEINDLLEQIAWQVINENF